MTSTWRVVRGATALIAIAAIVVQATRLADANALNLVRGPTAGWYPYPFLDPANGG